MYVNNRSEMAWSQLARPDEQGFPMTRKHTVRNEKLLAAAEGYLMLEMSQQAWASLDEIDDPEFSVFSVNYMRGLILRQKDDFANALPYLESALHERPDHLGVLLALAWCYKRVDRLDLAISTMEQAYGSSPTEPVVLYNLSCYWALTGNKTQSLSWLGRALRLNGDLKKLIPEEHDFDLLRDDPDFAHLVNLAE